LQAPETHVASTLFVEETQSAGTAQAAGWQRCVVESHVEPAAQSMVPWHGR
jgi:hypothetical protein